MIDYQLAKALFEYDPESGRLTWRLTTNCFKKGEEAGTVSKNSEYTSYRTVYVFAQGYKTHRIAWLLQTGSWPEKYIDHVDGDGLNNKWSNLREASPSENGMNQKVRSDSKSGVKGVSYDSARNMWYAYINLDGKRKHLGRHDTFEDAVAVRQEAEAKYYGDFARKVTHGYSR